MKACYTIIFSCLLAPLPGLCQNNAHPAAYTFNEGGSAISANVPLNEINTHAYRHFQRLFPTGTSREYWFRSEDGYSVSFLLKGRHFQAWFARNGAYRYSLQYYPGKEIPRQAGDLIKVKYPDYQIDVVTEITEGEKIFYLVKIISPARIKTLSVAEGKIAILEDLINECPSADDLLISQLSYP